MLTNSGSDPKCWHSCLFYDVWCQGVPAFTFRESPDKGQNRCGRARGFRTSLHLIADAQITGVARPLGASLQL